MRFYITGDQNSKKGRFTKIEALKFQAQHLSKLLNHLQIVITAKRKDITHQTTQFLKAY